MHNGPRLDTHLRDTKPFGFILHELIALYGLSIVCIQLRSLYDSRLNVDNHNAHNLAVRARRICVTERGKIFRLIYPCDVHNICVRVCVYIYVRNDCVRNNDTCYRLYSSAHTGVIRAKVNTEGMDISVFRSQNSTMKFPRRFFYYAINAAGSQWDSV